MKKNETHLNKIFCQGADSHVGVAEKWALELRMQRNSNKKIEQKVIKNLTENSLSWIDTFR